MTRSESLAKLHALAEWTRRDPSWAASHAFPYVRHGLAAVRAIRESVDSWTPLVVEGWKHNAIRESRLAFRAALRAVGISGSL